MKHFKLFAVAIALLALTVSCKKETTPEPDPEEVDMLRIDVNPVFDTEVLYLDSVYTTPEGYKIKLTDIKFFLENLENGSNQLADAALFDFRQNGSLLLEVEGKPANFLNLSANIGVGPSLNHDDPSAFSTASVLNIMNANDMHWDWNPGYIFFKIEGKADTIPDLTELYDLNFIFHVGLDANLKQSNFTNLTWNQSSDHLYQLDLTLDIYKFFTNSGNEIDLKTEHMTHSAGGQEALTAKAAENFKVALSAD